jgi:hypothetical protein
MIRRSHHWWLMAAMALLLTGVGCGSPQNNNKTDCPSFAEYQLYPSIGAGDTVYELYVRLKNADVDRKVLGVAAQLFTSNDVSAGVTFDLVRTEADHLRYLRTFRGADVCDIGTCSLFFNVIAEATNHCKSKFETTIFQVVIDQTDDDATADDDATDDDTTQ